MQKEFNLGSLLTTSMMRSSPMHSSKEEKKISPIHIVSTKEFSVLYVRAGQPPNVSFMHFSSAQDLASYLKFLGVSEYRQNILLRNLWKDTLASNTLKERLFQGMPEELGLQDWMEERLIFL